MSKSKKKAATKDIKALEADKKKQQAGGKLITKK